MQCTGPVFEVLQPTAKESRVVSPVIHMC